MKNSFVAGASRPVSFSVRQPKNPIRAVAETSKNNLLQTVAPGIDRQDSTGLMPADEFVIQQANHVPSEQTS